ncbi:MAG: hypothetical protein AAF975_01585, partial [Spirochaetota bacterium]
NKVAGFRFALTLPIQARLRVSPCLPLPGSVGKQRDGERPLRGGTSPARVAALLGRGKGRSQGGERSLERTGKAVPQAKG